MDNRSKCDDDEHIEIEAEQSMAWVVNRGRKLEADNEESPSERAQIGRAQ